MQTGLGYARNANNYDYLALEPSQTHKKIAVSSSYNIFSNMFNTVEEFNSIELTIIGRNNLNLAGICLRGCQLSIAFDKISPNLVQENPSCKLQ